MDQGHCVRFLEPVLREMDLQFRRASVEDVKRVAQLHAASWQLHYRGILDDHFLDNEVLADRIGVWKKRLDAPDEKMRIWLAEELGQLIGFGCVFLEEDQKYGTLLDNLHVLPTYSGKGVGSSLVQLLAKDIQATLSRQDMYLWVLKANGGAIRFYEKLKGQQKETVFEKEIGNRPVEKIRYYWPNVSSLLTNP